MRGRMTISDKLLLAALDLVQEGRAEFTAEDLVVSAWRKYPDAFGLSGHTDPRGVPMYPDSNRVFAEIMGSKPVRKQGYLRKVGTKMYGLTEAGRSRAASLVGGDWDTATTKASLPRDIGVELRRLLGSKAAEKVSEGRRVELTFYDACTFWGITPRSSAIELEGRLENMAKVVARAYTPLEGSSAAFEHGGPAYTRADLDQLRSVDEALQEMFSAELGTIRKRTDERL